MAGVSEGLVLHASDATIEREARRHGYAVMVSAEPVLAYDHTLLVEPGATVPWTTLGAGLRLLGSWEVAVPLAVTVDGQNVVLADSLGSTEERARTARVTRDLRVPVYASELVFVRRGEAGAALVDAWRTEMAQGGDRRLAFLRAVHAVKPRLCTLPAMWAGRMPAVMAMHAEQVPGDRLVRISLGPGRAVWARASQAEQVREQYRLMQMNRAERRREGR